MDHCDLGPDNCFGCKMRYWKQRGVPAKFTYGKKDFHGPTIRERRDLMVREAAEIGIKPEPAGVRWV